MANSSTSSIEILDRVLDKGDVSPLCNDCCPCGDIYVLASVETFLQLTSGLNWFGLSEDCPAVGLSWQVNCCTDNCVEKLKEIGGAELVDRLLDKGIVEYSLLGGKSMLCTLYDYFVQTNATEQEIKDALDIILDKGVVFKCYRDISQNVNGELSQTVFASVETFLKLYEALPAENPNCENCPNCDPPVVIQDPCQCLPEACCFSITASVETYLKYAEAVGLSGA
jgi:hypothetical protein